ncbi:hypothetical protein Kpol_264p2 [Vanderwaltozyma polyspora DSM 70294]|uniref:DNA polymerase alpha subunit B n=1 Tax=Vanderwaltozyma polyspora (strain ATCC 22028 / DSM 70294 / BCRC 21397 / CBS 2163 / NBRC 10782 / NRRL Y-8283 / UCD 57-17) TaxID=436907 RepID=A7TSY5_VANPO|nr:uncharacterized protein Kpol_264p2 [Vanderwaltozyma polyspora DSM 70294]EDO14616.1 hypothetical protein Kpol_264p2 [Vanderwaltozyma polyspora DSM 70294]
MGHTKELIDQFGPEVDDSSILETMESLLRIHALSVEDLFIKWEQFSVHRNETHTKLNQKNLESYKDFLQQQVEKRAQQIASSSNVHSSGVKPKIVKPIGSSPSLFGFNIPKTPTLKKRKLNVKDSNGGSVSNTSSKLEFSAGPANTIDIRDEGSQTTTPNIMNSSILELGSDVIATTPAPLKSSHESGKILDSLNPENMEVAEGLDFESEDKVRISPYFDAQKFKFRTMRQNLQDAADVLDYQIEMFKTIIQKHYELTNSDFGDPTIQSQSEIYTVGRIVPDSPTAEGFLNTESLALETSRSGGIGRRVRLDLTKVAELTLFCGQLVAFKGKNANGDYFMVEEIISLPYPDSPVSTSDDIQESQLLLDNKSMKVVITSGPYFPDNSFDLEYLVSFVEKINNEIKPHILIMFGPFVDVTNPLVAKGAIPNFPNLKSQPKTLDEIFTKVFVPLLKNINSKIQIILIPSTRDSVSKHAAYPQDSLDRKLLQLPKNFKCFTNPSTFQLNEVFFGCSNVDLFKDMKEITKGGNTSMRNRFDRVSEHMLQQRRYYPVLPGGIKKQPITENGKKRYVHISGADLDVPYLGLTEFIGGFAPDVIIVPSELQYFARVIQNVVVINPGRFVRPNGGRGTFIQMTIESPNLENGKLTKMGDQEEIYLHNIWKRVRVDIVTN